MRLDDAQLLFACGSSRWVALMRGEHADRVALHDAADLAFAQLGDADIREAMSHHPRIGDLARASASDAKEQAGAAHADDDIKDALVEGNRAYEARFGFIYLVCATGKTGAELLALLHARLANDPTTELAVAAEEQRKITHLRIDKLLPENA
ncbi:MAG: 2-oxo-4-hydroxy-4-carboxy-5-ureidoimidazoline decarboxylase [Polyangia bacterium]